MPQSKWLCAFLGETTDGIFIVDAAQRIVYWNRGAERILGYSQAEVFNKYCYEVIARKCCAKQWCHANCSIHKSVLRGILPDDFALPTCTKEGKDISINISTIVLPDNPKPLAAHLFCDETDQKRNEKAPRNTLSTLSVPDFIKSDPEGKKIAIEGVLRQRNMLSGLSRREVEVLSLVAEGISSIVIARRMGISSFTVRNHIRNTLKKLGLHSRAQAISFAFINGLLDSNALRINDSSLLTG